MTGKIAAVNGPVVDVEFSGAEALPGMYEILEALDRFGRQVTLEVMEHLSQTRVRCISLATSINVVRGSEVRSTGKVIEVPVGEKVLSRVLNVLGQPIDGLGPIEAEKMKPIRRRDKKFLLNPEMRERQKFEILETGIKMVDLLFPLIKGSKNGILGGAALGKSLLTLEVIHNVVHKHHGACVFTGVGERIREGHELYHELKRTGILDRVALVYGQMDEPPGARFEAILTGITLAEHLREKNQDVLFFVDSVYRFAQAGMEVSTLMGHIPSETGYQPTLSSEMSEFHERIQTEAAGSITAVESVYVPADDLTDPAVVTIFSYLDSIVVLSRARVQKGLYPAIDPLLSSTVNLDPDIVGKRHFDIAQETLRILRRLEELNHIVSVIGIEELSKSDRLLYERGLRLQNFLTQPFFTAELHTGRPGAYVPVGQTLNGCRMILDGRFDQVPEDKLYLIGELQERRREG
ncbi:MAG: F0F1 ATP synthase subunit beta [Candidatus Omnitrophica bacterium]|nr:F0F1 ATP synthase subunit beta [Candidatus Omnitrophota bacterium]